MTRSGKEARMHCPTCGSTMVRGRFGNHSEGGHVPAFGSFGLPLAFSPEDDGEPARTLWMGDRDGMEGHACPDCGTVLLPEPPRGEDWRCPACGEMVPDKFDICWKCQHRRPRTDAGK